MAGGRGRPYGWGPESATTDFVLKLLIRPSSLHRIVWLAGRSEHRAGPSSAGCRAVIARKEGLTRARVTQILDLLKLAPEIREHILAMPSANGHRPLSERSLRPLIGQPPSRQLAQFKRLLHA